MPWPRSRGRTGSIIEIRALQALAQAAGGDHPAALTTLTEALSLGATECYVQVFVDEGPPMATLLGKLLAGRHHKPPRAVDTVPRAYRGRLVAAFERAGLALRPRPARRGGRGGAAGAAQRPRAGGARAAGGRQTNRGIAQELVITLDTVKRHVSHLFAKLQVANRTQAVARARQLGLLP